MTQDTERDTVDAEIAERAIRESRGQVALQETRAHAERARTETELRDDAIRRARAAGLPLRRIADAASLSHMQIKNICDKKES